MYRSGNRTSSVLALYFSDFAVYRACYRKGCYKYLEYLILLSRARRSVDVIDVAKNVPGSIGTSAAYPQVFSRDCGLG